MLRLWKFKESINEMVRNKVGESDIQFSLKILKQSHIVTSCAFSPDEKWIATTGGNGALHCWNVEEGQLSFTMSSEDTKGSSRTGALDQTNCQ